MSYSQVRPGRSRDRSGQRGNARPPKHDYLWTQEREDKWNKMVRDGVSESEKEYVSGKWLRDDTKIQEIAKEYNLFLEKKDIMGLRYATIQYLLCDYRFYKIYDDLNNDFWKANGRDLDEHYYPSTVWFKVEPNYWFEKKLKGFYNKLNMLVRVADHGQDPSHFPVIDDLYQNKIRINIKLLNRVFKEEADKNEKKHEEEDDSDEDDEE